LYRVAHPVLNGIHVRRSPSPVCSFTVFSSFSFYHFLSFSFFHSITHSQLHTFTQSHIFSSHIHTTIIYWQSQILHQESQEYTYRMGAKRSEKRERRVTPDLGLRYPTGPQDAALPHHATLPRPTLHSTMPRCPTKLQDVAPTRPTPPGRKGRIARLLLLRIHATRREVASPVGGPRVSARAGRPRPPPGGPCAHAGRPRPTLGGPHAARARMAASRVPGSRIPHREGCMPTPMPG
jgi:hypothetical protein